MRDGKSHCRLCAEPYARSQLVCMDDEMIDAEEKMSLINVDVSAPSPLPRGVCYSCLCLLERTCTFLHQVSAAQRKLAQIYQDNKDLVDEADNMDDDIAFSVKEELSDDERAEIKAEPCHDELPEPASAWPLVIDTVQRRRGKPKKKAKKIIKDINIQEPLDAAVAKKRPGRPRKAESKIKYVNIEIRSENGPLKTDKKEKKNGKPKEEPNDWDYEPNPKRRKGSRKFVCRICSKSFMYKDDLMGHMRFHREKRFKCEVCGDKFYTRTHLKRHATRHSSARPFECDQCGRTFAQKRYLAVHLTVHSDLRPYVCSDCQKAFRTKAGFDVHVNMHMDIRPYCCELCGKVFFSITSLYKHVQSVHHGADPRRRKRVNNNSNELRHKEVADLMLQNS